MLTLLYVSSIFVLILVTASRVSLALVLRLLIKSVPSLITPEIVLDLLSKLDNIVIFASISSPSSADLCAPLSVSVAWIVAPFAISSTADATDLDTSAEWWVNSDKPSAVSLISVEIC